jgi:phage gp36-like protein
MPYSTQDDVRVAVGGADNLVELADLEATNTTDGGAGVAMVVTKAIAEADGYIDAFLRKRFAVPLPVVPGQIGAISSSWASRVLRRNRYKGQPMTEDENAEKVDREFLGLVANGTVDLGLTPTSEKSQLIIDKAGQRDSSLQVSSRRMKGFI